MRYHIVAYGDRHNYYDVKIEGDRPEPHNGRSCSVNSTDEKNAAIWMANGVRRDNDLPDLTLDELPNW